MRLVKQKAYVLLPVIIAITLIAAIAYMLSRESGLAVNMASNQLETVKAEYVAQAGMQHTLNNLNGCGPYTDLTNIAFGEGNYSSTITLNNPLDTVTSYTVGVTDDAFIDINNPTQNYGSVAQLEVSQTKTPITDKRALYRFDIESAGIAAGATVVSAIARFHLIDPHDSATIYVDQVTAYWTEAAVNWNTINTSRNSSSIASIPQNSPTDQFIDVNLSSLAQGWINGTVINQGVMLNILLSDTNDLSQFASKEYGTLSKRPELIINISDGAISTHADISVTGTLSNGATHTIEKKDIMLFQHPSTLVWQPGSSLKDTFVWDGKHVDTNFGVSPILNIKVDRNILIRYPVEELPKYAIITDAKLQLYLEGGIEIVDGVLDVHTTSRDWVEGTYNDQIPAPGEGASYASYDGITSWDVLGGDYDPTIIDSVTLPSIVPGWYEWNVTQPVQNWFDGADNFGLFIREGAGVAWDINFISSDNTVSPQYRPRLSVTLACPCGISCQIPSGSGNLLLAVGDDVNLDSSDSKRKTLFESWGYKVSVIDDGTTQVNFDAAADNNDVVYLSSTVKFSALNFSIWDETIGIVNDNAGLIKELGLSSASTVVAGNATTIVDNSHFITENFPLAAVPIYQHNMEGASASGTQALGLQNLATWNGLPGLATVETGDRLTWGATYSNGRRVTLPVGSSNIYNWDFLNNNGQLLTQRAIEWAADTYITGPTAHWKLDETGGLIAFDTEGGHQGNLTNGPNWDFGAKKGSVQFSENQHAIIVPHHDSLSITNQLTLMSWVYLDSYQTSRAIVNKGTSNLDHTYYLGLNNSAIQFALSPDAGGWNSVSSGDTGIQLNTWHHVAVTFDDNSDSVNFYLDGVNIKTESTIITPQINVGDVRIGRNFDGYHFPGRLDDVRIYNSVLTTEKIAELAVRVKSKIFWTDDSGNTIQSADENGTNVITVVSGQNSVTGLDIDSINNKLYWTSNTQIKRSNFDGTNIEIVYSDSLIKQDIKLDAANGKMYWTHGADSNQITSADLGGANTKVINSALNQPGYLTFDRDTLLFYVTELGSGDVSRMKFDGKSLVKLITGTGTATGNAQDVTSGKVYWSSGSGGDWIKRANLDGSSQETILTGLNAPQDIAYDSINDRIYWAEAGGTKSIKRANADGTNVHSIVSSGLNTPRGIIIIDAALAAGTGGGGGPAPTICNGTYLDNFDNAVMDGSAGTLDWSTSPWVEVKESDGLAAGDVRVVSDLSDNRLRIKNKNKGAERTADLSGATTATLSFNYRRTQLDSSDDYVAVTISSDGGSSWQSLGEIGTTNDSSYQSFSADISAYISANTLVRLRSSATLHKQDIIYFDDFLIECIP